MVLTLLALSALVLPAPPSQVSAHYRLEVLPEESSVQVQLTLAGIEAERDSIELALPTGFSFVTLPEPLLSGEVSAEGRSGLEVQRTSPYSWKVVTEGSTEIEVNYRVPLEHRDQPAVREENDEYEFPYLTKDHGFLVAGTLLMQLQEPQVTERRVEFALPEGWDVLAPWVDHEAGGFAPRTDQALANDLIAVGAWEQRRIEVGDYTAILAAAPGQEVLLERCADPLEAIIREELDLFDVLPNGRYLFLFSRPDTPGFGGSPKTSSMSLNVDLAQLAQAGDYLNHLVAHEFFHTWAMSRATLPGELRWVNEGITDYFAYTTQLRLGLSTLEDWHRQFAGKLGEFQNNPARARMSLAEAGGPAFFEGGDAYDLTYAGGLVMGAYLDAALRQAGDFDLVDVMRAFTNDKRWDDKDAKPTSEDFYAVVKQFGDEALAEGLRGWVEAPFDKDLVEAFAEVGVALEAETAPAASSPRSNFDGTTVTGIDPKGQGFQLGLRSGDRVLEVNGKATTTTGELQRAWAQSDGKTLRAVIERDGSRIELQLALVDQTRFLVKHDSWG